MEHSLTIIGVFFSGYKDLWNDFVQLFRQNWPDCPYTITIVSDTSVDGCSYEGIPLLNAGNDAEYSRKVQIALNRIQSDYFLLLLEDFFIGSRVNNEVVEGIMNYIINNDIKYYAMPMKEFSNNYKGKKINKDLRQISTNAEYTVSCQPAIWQRDFLKQCIGNENYNAWVFEGIYAKSKTAHTKDFLKGCIANTNNPLNIMHGALQGKIVPSTRDFFSSSGYYFSNSRDEYPRQEYKKQQIKIFLRGLMPYWMQKGLKKVLKTSSIMSKYSLKISEVMEKMKIN